MLAFSLLSPRRKSVLLGSSLIAAAVGCGTAGCGPAGTAAQTAGPGRGAPAAARPAKPVRMAPVAVTTAPPVPPGGAIGLMELAAERTLADPAHWAQCWYDVRRGQVVIAIKRGSPARVWADARRLAGRRNSVVPVVRSASDLAALQERLVGRREVAGIRINHVGVDWRYNRVTAGVDRVTVALRGELGAQYGDTVAVAAVRRAHTDIGRQ